MNSANIDNTHIIENSNDTTSTYSLGRLVYTASPQPIVPKNNNTKLFGNRDSSGVTESLANMAIGKGFKTNLSYAFSTTTTDRNVINSAQNRVRSGGSVAPAKKGANR